ncbi:MAG: hypothetical protein QOE76_4241, partial [Frankiales bacterium]|nr:hypothetical protein [Frankiales bacterium]
MSRRSEPATRPLVSAALAAAVTAGGLAFLDAGTGPSWRRRNYRGVEVTLSAGPAVAAGLLVGVGARRELTGVTVAVAGAALAGFYDDCRSVRDDERVVKGFAGHLRALA